ncbi:hypothetical protein DB32_002473 [Sandaracinus amylolyticus]|uniref:Uncharacterized protein n=1 Tax=Sandaracinus amylolyticus TaxID=927083 RepID=A0A0F6SEJ9_9BACT|nr:hypothetical protein DB32_002473 [Sandaracinus amylolyticus]
MGWLPPRAKRVRARHESATGDSADAALRRVLEALAIRAQ